MLKKFCDKCGVSEDIREVVERSSRNTLRYWTADLCEQCYEQAQEFEREIYIKIDELDEKLLCHIGREKNDGVIV